MSGNDLDDHGLEVAKALATSRSITSVDMSENGIGDYGPEVAEALATSRSITSVNISSNHFGLCRVQIAEALVKSDSIVKVDMSRNTLRHTELSHLDEEEIPLEDSLLQDTIAVFEAHNKYIDDLVACVHYTEPLTFMSVGVAYPANTKTVTDLIGEYLDAPIDYTL